MPPEHQVLLFSTCTHPACLVFASLGQSIRRAVEQVWKETWCLCRNPGIHCTWDVCKDLPQALTWGENPSCWLMAGWESRVSWELQCPSPLSGDKEMLSYH